MSEKTKLYRPSNGTEGDCFYSAWCANCEHDRAFREDPDSGDPCDILGMTMVLSTEDKGYPEEWRYNSDGVPVCMGYMPERENVDTAARCTKTVDMFDGGEQ